MKSVGIFIAGVEKPECCGECFAFDDSGCKFVKVDKNSPDIWQKRAEDCPIQRCFSTCSLLNKDK